MWRIRTYGSLSGGHYIINFNLTIVLLGGSYAYTKSCWHAINDVCSRFVQRWFHGSALGFAGSGCFFVGGAIRCRCQFSVPSSCPSRDSAQSARDMK